MKSLLLADDSMTIQKVVELSFTDEDVEVTSVGNGLAALDSFWESRQDIVLADIVMPGEDGYEVCRQIKEKSPGTPVVLLVGTFESFDEEQAASCRSDASLTKPFETSKLIRLVKDLLAKAEQFPSTAPTNTEQHPSTAPIPIAQSYAPMRLSILSSGADDITIPLTRLERRVVLPRRSSPSQAVAEPAVRPAPSPPATVVQVLPVEQPAAATVTPDQIAESPPATVVQALPVEQPAAATVTPDQVAETPPATVVQALPVEQPAAATVTPGQVAESPPATVVQALPVEQPAAATVTPDQVAERFVSEIMSRLAPTISEEIRKVMFRK